MRGKKKVTENTGLIVAIEGPDGSGKSSIIDTMKELLDNDDKYIFSKEPGGTPQGNFYRKLILEADTNDATRDLLLFEASRRELYNHILKPAMAEGKIVILDRYTPSTYVYQDEFSYKTIQMLNRLATDESGLDIPDIVIYLDIPLEEQVRRIQNRADNDRFDTLDTDGLIRIRKRYKTVLGFYHDVYSIDATQGTDAAAKEIIKIIEEKYYGIFH